MKHVSLLVSVCVMIGVAACSGDDGGGIEPPDAAIDVPDQPGTCNPVAPPGSQGCEAGQKCTWIRVQDAPTPIGKLGCVADGAAQVGGACTRGAPGESSGFDDCVAGAICISGTCQDICGFDGSAGAACATGYACTRYDQLFANNDDDPVAGACKASCDPLTGAITGGGACPAGEGCYPLVSATETIAVCADAGTPTHGQAITGPPFANSCAPGHVPRRPSQGSTSWECGALCRPNDVTSTRNMTDEGGVAPFTCEAKGASPPESATAGESCRYWWANEDVLSPFSNTLGFCWKHAVFQYDSNGDMTPDAPFPRCVTLTEGDVVPPIGNPPHNDARYFWCLAQPTALTGAVHNVRKWYGLGGDRPSTLRSWR